ncbi:hypothetical protein LTR36_009581 [Oleoguttula mirabilis]|uniref:Tautomerase cis-CaaD-like domain-containing protein n=1 Tax=Oleoguttula mirabilis TaxID=1507867 RepID=A0AAV9JUF9_9PEZI|nr:hypothetical protein LTR36_009581 [Oleoguttula mirabilis]
MADADGVKAEAEAFAKVYAALFSSPACSSAEHVAEVASSIGKHYRPGITFFTNGGISRFDVRFHRLTAIVTADTGLQSRQEAADLIEKEMRKAISYGIGVHLDLLEICKVEVYSQTSALCWLHWAFRPKPGSEYEGKDCTFTNIYGYRAATAGVEAGWEFVVRDEEVNAMFKSIGKSFDD